MARILVSLFFLVADFHNIQSGQSNGCASFDSISGIFETIRIIPICSSAAADVTRCVAELSAPDEMSALIRPTYLHYNSYYGVVLVRIATASAIALERLHGKVSVDSVACHLHHDSD